ncbi:hypothetical protein ABZZ37_16130 [Streptomyces sp. NPDC006464]
MVEPIEQLDVDGAVRQGEGEQPKRSAYVDREMFQASRMTPRRLDKIF